MSAEAVAAEEKEGRRAPEWLAWLWLLAGLVAIVLLLTTGALYLKAHAQADIFAGAVAGPAGSVYLRSRPHPQSSVVTLLQAGQPVQAVGSREIEGTRWYQVETERGDGWLPAERVERSD